MEVTLLYYLSKAINQYLDYNSRELHQYLYHICRRHSNMQLPRSIIYSEDNAHCWEQSSNQPDWLEHM